MYREKVEVKTLPRESAYFIVENLSDKSDRKGIMRGISALPGVISVTMSPIDTRLAVDFDNTGTNLDKIEDRLKELGFETVTDSNKNQLM